MRMVLGAAPAPQRVPLVGIAAARSAPSLPGPCGSLPGCPRARLRPGAPRGTAASPRAGAVLPTLPAPALFKNEKAEVWTHGGMGSATDAEHGKTIAP